ncbi:MAG: DUF3775 domain-containing protein [Hyphomicrobiales bacterium]|jgi:hypothetical protein|nr:DUF3775 domain-containing protein [Hyphomicrobiales bacterium]
MINLNPETVTKIAEHAREFQVSASMEMDDSPVLPIDASAIEQLTEWHGDPDYTDLRNAIDDLEPDQQATIVALMWLGRGDYEFDDWDQALKYASEADGVSTADYLIATPLLADYLMEGLSLHGYDTD